MHMASDPPPGIALGLGAEVRHRDQAVTHKRTHVNTTRLGYGNSRRTHGCSTVSEYRFLAHGLRIYGMVLPGNRDVGFARGLRCHHCF